MHKPCKEFHKNKKQIETRCTGKPSDRPGNETEVTECCKRCEVFIEDRG